MPGDVCKDCGMMLSPDTSLCPVCGFDNRYDARADADYNADLGMQLYGGDECAPENYPGL